MILHRLFVTALTACLCLSGAAQGQRQSGGPRIALVIGNAQYADPLATPANDAGLVAETLRGAGFDVTGAANLDQDSLRRAFRDFLDKAAHAGPDAIAFVYLSGRGLQYEGDNYFTPVDAVIAHDSDIPLQALRISDYTRALAAMPLRARIIVLDAARGNRFAEGGHLAGGLALVDADPGSLYAFNAAPGTIAPDEPGPYGAYAQALSELLRQGGVPIDMAFSQVRLRVNETTRGALTPWNAANIAPPLVLLEGAPNAPAAAVAQSYAALRSRPIRSFPAGEAYAAALERDTLEGYQDFLAVYPGDPLTARVRALLAARREALTWRRTRAANTPGAYWSYMQRYPKGPHFYDARRRLTFLSEPAEPPPDFDVYDFGGLPPPPPAEYIIVDRPVVIFEPDMYPPPPPPPVYFLPPPLEAFVSLPRPPPPQGPGFLPIPIPIPVPFGRNDGPQGRFNQPNFGQQAPVGPAGAPGVPGAPAAPGVPVAPAAVPPVAPAAPTHALPQGTSLPPIPGGTRPAGAPAPGAPLKPATPAAAPVPATAPAAGPAAPTHALPRGTSLPPIPGGTLKPAAPAAGAGAPNHAVPQGKALPPVPGASGPGRGGPGAPAAPLAEPKPAAPPASVKPAAAPKAAAPAPRLTAPPQPKPPAEPKPQPAPQMMPVEQQRVQRPQPQPPRPQPQAQPQPPRPPPQAQPQPPRPPPQAQPQPPRPSPQAQPQPPRPPPQAQPQPPRPQPQAQPQPPRPQPQAQPKPAGKPIPGKPGEQPNHP
jgi:uncharacterized caspase-like protein